MYAIYEYTQFRFEGSSKRNLRVKNKNRYNEFSKGMPQVSPTVAEKEYSAIKQKY